MTSLVHRLALPLHRENEGDTTMATKPKYKLKSTPIEESIVEAYKRMEQSIVNSYFAIEHRVVGTYQKIEDKFVDTFLEVDENDDENDDK